MSDFATKQDIKELYQFCSQLNDMVNTLTDTLVEHKVMTKEEIETKYVKILQSIYTPLKGGCLMELYNLEN